MTYVFHPSQLETDARIRENVKEIVSDLSTDYFYSFVDKYTNQKLVHLSNPIKVTLSQNMMKNTYVQRLLSDMGGKLDSFLIQQSRENPIEFEEFLRGRLPKLPEKLEPVHKRISFPSTGTTTPSLLEPKKYPNTIPSKEVNNKKRNKSVPSGKNKAGSKEEGEKTDNGPPVSNYFTSHLGQNFVQTVGKTEQIRDSLSTLVQEMDQNVYYEYMKAKSTWKDVEELFKTKERVVNILEEIVNKEYISAQEMADDMGENWDVTEEYEKIIADMVKDHNKEKESVKQCYERRIYALKENTICEINELKQEISELKALNLQKEEQYAFSNQAKDYEIEILSGKVTIMQTQIYKLEERAKTKAPNPNSSKVSNRDTMSKAGSEYTRKADTQRSKLVNGLQDNRPNSRMSGSTTNHKTKKPSGLKPPQIHIQNIEEVQMHEQNFIQENLLDITSINEEERSRLSLSSRDVSAQHLLSVSRKVSDDWLGDEETRKIRALRGFFLKLYEKVLIKKGGSVDSHTSFEGSDDESNMEDFGLEMYDTVLKQMANAELCEAAGVRPMTAGGLIGDNKHSVRKKMPLLFTKKKRPTLAMVEPIEEKINEENKYDKQDATLITLENDNGPHTGFRGTQRVFEGCKGDLIDIIEGILNDKLPAHTKQLSIPRLFEQEVPLDLEKMLTIDNLKEGNKVHTEYVIVTVEQLIMNALNFYVSLLQEKADLIKIHQLGKRYFGKVYQNIATDTAGLPGNGVKKNQAMQTDGPVHFEVEVRPEQILQDSLVSWKKRLEDVRGSRPQRSNYTSFDRGSSPKNQFFMTQTSSKFDFKPRTPAENIHSRLKNRISHNSSVYESRKALESGEQSREEQLLANAHKSFYYTAKPPSQENLQKERAFWRNVLPDELFSRHGSKPHNAIEPIAENVEAQQPFSQTQTKMKLAPMNMTTTMLEMPFQEKAIPKKEEIRNKILMEKSKFISYKNEESPFKPRLDGSVEPVKVKREANNKITGKESPDEIGELCKRTVIALHDYIMNIQKDITNQTRMKFDLADVNKKVGEIEEMLQFGLADKKYVALIDHFQKQGVRPEAVKDSEITAYLQDKRNELRHKVKEALESHLIPTLSKNNPSYDNSNLLGNQREPPQGFHSAQKPRNNSLANQNLALFMSDSKLEGFARETESSQFDFESRNSPRVPSFREPRGETRESPYKNQTPLIKEEIPELQKAEQEQTSATVQNYQSISGNHERDQVLKRLSISHQVNEIMNNPKFMGGDKAKKDREHREVKKAAFKVKKMVTPSKDKTLNKTIL